MLLANRPSMDETTRRQLLSLVVGFLRSPAPPSSFTTDDAAATSSRGYSYGIEAPWQDPLDPQPPGYAVLVRRGQVSSGRVSQFDVAPDAGPAPRESPRWEVDVARLADTDLARWERKWPLYLRLGVPRALAALCPLDREIVRLCGAKWMSYRGAGELVGREHHTVRAHYDDALLWIVGQIWDGDGTPKWG